jgi:hypothetical protein
MVSHCPYMALKLFIRSNLVEIIQNVHSKNNYLLHYVKNLLLEKIVQNVKQPYMGGKTNKNK